MSRKNQFEIKKLIIRLRRLQHRDLEIKQLLGLNQFTSLDALLK